PRLLPEDDGARRGVLDGDPRSKVRAGARRRARLRQVREPPTGLLRRLHRRLHRQDRSGFERRDGAPGRLRGGVLARDRPLNGGGVTRAWTGTEASGTSSPFTDRDTFVTAFGSV